MGYDSPKTPFLGDLPLFGANGIWHRKPLLVN